MTGFLIEWRRSPLRWWALPLIGLACLLTLSTGGFPPDSWPRASAAATAAGLPFMIGALALCADRAARAHRNADTSPVSARPPHHAALTRLAADLGWLLPAYTVPVLILWTATWRAGAPGSPWLEYPVFGMTGIIFAAGLGHLAGTLAPSRFTGLIAATGALVLFLFVFTQDSPLTASVPYQAISFRLAETHLMWRAAAAACAVILAIAAPHLAARLTARRDGVPRLPRPARTPLLAAGALAGVLLAMPNNPDAPLVGPRTSPAEPVCAQASGSEVCVWPEHAHRLKDAVSAVTAVHTRGLDILPPADRYTEDGLSGTGFLLDHGKGDLLATLVTQQMDEVTVWCTPEPDPDRMLHHQALSLWLETRVRQLDAPPSYGHYGDTSHVDEVTRVLALPEQEQLNEAQQWAHSVSQPC